MNELEYMINCNNCDNAYMLELTEYFNRERSKIFEFFGIKKLSKKLIITLYDDIDKYAEYRNHKLSESSVANIDEDKNKYYIHMLSYKEMIKRKGHEYKNLEDYYKILMHEFVHVCHQDKGNIYDSLTWIREGIAITLSQQNYEEKELDCTLEDLLNNNQVSYSNYYTLMNYVLNHYDKNYSTMLVIDSMFGKEETSNIYNEYINNKKSIRNI